MADKWIQKAVPESHKGMLHKALHVPEDENIPAGKLAKAANSSNSHMRHMAQFAKNVKRAKGGKVCDGQGKITPGVDGKASKRRYDRMQ